MLRTGAPEEQKPVLDMTHPYEKGVLPSWELIAETLWKLGYFQIDMDYTLIIQRDQEVDSLAFLFPCREFNIGELKCYVPNHVKNENRFWIYTGKTTVE